jgi:glycosyltransferase involved in cell wall biosynthesis
VICLLPVRNGAGHLPAYLKSVSRVCDAVVALDDGSTDETRGFLDEDPLVQLVLSNPKRDSVLGWNDGENRNRLLEASAELQPDWILFLDLDERMDPSDARALRAFVVQEALAGCVYGFQLYRMTGAATYDPNYDWVYRLFAFRPGQRVPDKRLDFNPIPSGVPRIRTSLRIEHLGEETPAGRESRLAKYREADPTGEFSSYYENFRPFTSPPPGGYPTWAARPSDLPVLGQAVSAPPSPSALADANAVTADTVQGGVTPFRGRKRVRLEPRIVCLLPVRNCEDDLPGWFDSVSLVVDSVVALDDGSTDRTGAILRSHPLVEVLLSNPPRPSFAGWDDARNRNRLLVAASALEPDWILSLDADERIPPEDAHVVRRFILEQAVPGFAYGFPRYRMVDDQDHYDHLEYVAWRLFAWAPNQRFPTDRLHATPIPTDVSATRRIETTIRIQHLAGLTEERRRARWEKYRQADPDRVWEADYEYVRASAGPRCAWPRRSADLPVVIEPTDTERRQQWELAQLNLQGPVLTVAVIAESSVRRADVELTLDSIFEHPPRLPVEVLLIAPPGLVDKNPSSLQDDAPDLRLVPPDGVRDPTALRNMALRAAKGDYVLFVTAGQPLTTEGLREVVEAHERGFALVGTEVVNQTLTAVGWTSYFLDHASGLPGGLLGTLEMAPAAGSVAREALLAIGGLPAAVSGLGVVGEVLVQLGYRAWRSTLSLDTTSSHRGWIALLRDQLQRGHTLAKLLQSATKDDASLRRRTLTWALRRGPRRLRSIRRHVAYSDRTISEEFRRVSRMVTLGVFAEWTGLLSELLLPSRWSRRTLVGRLPR